MYRIALLSSLFLLSLASASAQNDTLFKRVRYIKGDIKAFGVDNLENIYVLSSLGQLKKLNEKGDSVAVFNDIKKYGEASQIDVSNPLKVLLYYRDFSTIVILDRLLNVRTAIDLRRQNMFQVKSVALSYDSKIWVYDEMDSKLKKIDDDGRVLLETPDFRQLFGDAPMPVRLFDQDKYVYLYDPARAVYVFDYYGALKNKILITGWKNFRVAGKYFFGTSADQLYRYDITSFRYDEWKMPENLRNARQLDFSAGKVYALQAGGIEIYNLQ